VGTAPTPSRPRRGELDPDALAALEEERTFLLRSLDDLEREHEAGDVDDVDYDALKDDYTARAAAVIRAIEQRHAAYEQARAPARRSRTLLWVALLLVGSVALGVFVAQSSGRREAGDSLSGDIRATTRDQLFDARIAQDEGRFRDAIDLYDEVLAAQPANTEALTYKGWLLFLTSRETEDPADTQVLLARAKQLLDDALTADPGYGDALVFRAQVLRALGFDEQALADLDAVEPGSIPTYMQPLVDGLRRDLERRSGADTGTTVPAAGP
jgi:tetratricopeptide (TPR) repeat protein